MRNSETDFFFDRKIFRNACLKNNAFTALLLKILTKFSYDINTLLNHIYQLIVEIFVLQQNFHLNFHKKSFILNLKFPKENFRCLLQLFSGPIHWPAPFKWNMSGKTLCGAESGE